ncbi:MAG: L-arabinonolactonase [Arenicella sp.]|jgi:L-arabinonolactonase
MIELISTIPVQNELGEGIIWDNQRQRLWWTDIDNCRLYRYDPITENLEQWSTPERLCCFAPVAGQDYLVAAFESGFAFYDPLTGSLDWIKKIESDNPGTRLNDGRTDRQGRMWAGTMVENSDLALYRGSLYCLDNKLVVRKTIGELLITNSLCWSPDSKRMYHCDTPRQKINCYPFEALSGEIGDRELLVNTEKNCYPDGSIVDAQGYLWNAQWGGSKVVRYAPDGSTNLEISIPVSQPTCAAFGGPNLDLLFITTARQGLSEEALRGQSQAGDVFVYKTDYRGLVESAFIRS